MFRQQREWPLETMRIFFRCVCWYITSFGELTVSIAVCDTVFRRIISAIMWEGHTWPSIHIRDVARTRKIAHALYIITFTFRVGYKNSGANHSTIPRLRLPKVLHERHARWGCGTASSRIYKNVENKWEQRSFSREKESQVYEAKLQSQDI